MKFATISASTYTFKNNLTKKKDVNALEIKNPDKLPGQKLLRTFYNSSVFKENKPLIRTISVFGETPMVIFADDCAFDLLVRSQKIMHGMGINCLVMYEHELNAMTKSYLGNDIKYMLSHGAVSGLVPEMVGNVEPPDPARMVEDDIIWNMSKCGFHLYDMNGPINRAGADTRPEYVFAAVLFDRNMRRIDSGLPVLLCNANINHALLIFLARKYRFAGTLFGLMLDLKLLGRDGFNKPISILSACGVIPTMPIKGITKEALRVYGC